MHWLLNQTHCKAHGTDARGCFPSNPPAPQRARAPILLTLKMSNPRGGFVLSPVHNNTQRRRWVQAHLHCSGPKGLSRRLLSGVPQACAQPRMCWEVVISISDACSGGALSVFRGTPCRLRVSGVEPTTCFLATDSLRLTIVQARICWHALTSMHPYVAWTAWTTQGKLSWH